MQPDSGSPLQSPIKAVAETGSISSNTSVTSLRQRFEKQNEGKPQLPNSAAVAGGTTKQPVPTSLLIKDNSIVPEGTEELLQEQEKAAKKAVIASEAESVRPMSASLGATSMTEPESTLPNPFAAASSSIDAWTDGSREPPLGSGTQPADGTRTSSVELPPSRATDGQGQASSSRATAEDPTGAPNSGMSPLRLEASDSEEKPSSIEDALSEAQNAGLVRESKRWSASAASSAGRAGRRSAILGDRSSIDGVNKLKENFERLHQRERKLDSTLPGSPSKPSQVKEEIEELDDHIDWNFWGKIMSDYQDVARSRPEELSKAIQNGIPAALRGMMWQLMSGSKDEEMELIYAFYLKQTSSHEKAIRRDLARTFPEQDYFQDGSGTGQENLFNVVKAYSLYDEECGYCQGMQFVVGPLLLNMPEEEAFSTLVRLMKAYDLRGHFIPNMPSLQLRLYQFNRLLEDNLPLLHMHLVRVGIKSSMYASQWFMTLFSYRFPLELVYRILDSVFAEGIEALFRFAMALMQRNEDALCKMNFETCLSFLKENLFDLYQKDERDEKGKLTYRTNEFVQDAFQIRIMSYNLDQYAAEFEEQVRAANAHRREVEALRLVNRNLAARVKELEENASAQSTEHVELVKQVVMANLAKDDLATELAAYKQMYAEAVLAIDHRRLPSRQA